MLSSFFQTIWKEHELQLSFSKSSQWAFVPPSSHCVKYQTQTCKSIDSISSIEIYLLAKVFPLERINTAPQWPTDLWPPGCQLPFVTLFPQQPTHKEWCVVFVYLSECVHSSFRVIVVRHVNLFSLLWECHFLLGQYPQWPFSCWF